MKKEQDPLGSRMKEFYENRTRILLPRRTNTIIRLDGKSFKSYTRGLQKPFDNTLVEDMNTTTLALCSAIEGVKLAFVQSDEITLFMTDYDTQQTSAWFDNNLQKMASISASIATMNFNKVRWARGIEKNALFDARVFQIPHIKEVHNNFLWRQLDCTKNSISTVAQSLYSHKELHGKTCNMMQEMIYQKSKELVDMLWMNKTMSDYDLAKPNFNWNDLPVGLKRGRIAIKLPVNVPNTLDPSKPDSVRNKWQIIDAPDFAKETEFVERLSPLLVHGIPLEGILD
jgi:tRNA(His) guanylyltransferase